MTQDSQVLDFLAPTDGVSDSAEALQRALDSGAREIRVPTGSYKIGKTLRMRSGTALRAAADARFILADGAATTEHDYLLTNADPAGGNDAISITGGIWDGNNAGNPRPGPSLTARGYTGAIFHFDNVTNLTLGSLEMRNAEAYYARFTRVRQFHIESVGFGADIVRSNNDGIHLGGFCEDGVIRHLTATEPGVTGDDMVALNADDASERTEVFGMANGPIRRIRIEHIYAPDCHTFVRLLSVWSPIEDVTIRDVRGGCQVAAINADAARNCRVRVFDAANPPYADGVGLLRRIHASGFRVHKSSSNQIPLLRLETRMSNFQVEDFLRERDHDQGPHVPTLRIGHIVLKAFQLNGEMREALGLENAFEMDEDAIGLHIS